MEAIGAGVHLVMLGVMQDAGLPHAGCRCPRCRAAFADPSLARWAASAALVDARSTPPGVWLIDATPDIKYQLDRLAPQLGCHPTRAERLRQPDGIFLTHGHMGHTAGLVHFGPEGMAASALPLYAPAGLIAVLQHTALWQPMLQSFTLHPLQDGQAVSLGSDLTVTPVQVPHRDEWGTGTFAYHIRGPARSLLYMPDIDSWEDWPQAREVLAQVDVAIVDATFYSTDELAGRPPVAHPLVPATLRFMRGLQTQLVLTHLNHTNPLLDGASPEQQSVLAAGARIAAAGMIFAL
jgi:pyrroloquinoline quinone biosynthesis protein B